MNYKPPESSITQEVPFVILDNYRGCLPIQVFVNYVGLSPGNNNIKQFTGCCKGGSIRIPFPPEIPASTASFRTVWYNISDCDRALLSESLLKSKEPTLSVQRKVYTSGSYGVSTGGEERPQVNVRGHRGMLLYRDEVSTPGASATVAVTEWRDECSQSQRGVECNDRIIIWITLLRKAIVHIGASQTSNCRASTELPHFIMTVDRRMNITRLNRERLMAIDFELLNPAQSGVLIVDKEQSLSNSRRRIERDQRLYLRWSQIHPGKPLVTNSCFCIYEKTGNLSEPLGFLYIDATWNVSDFSPLIKFSFSYEKSWKWELSDMFTECGESLEIQILENLTIGSGLHVVIAVLVLK